MPPWSVVRKPHSAVNVVPPRSNTEPRGTKRVEVDSDVVNRTRIVDDPIFETVQVVPSPSSMVVSARAPSDMLVEKP